MKTETYVLPEFWASALINNDYTGYSTEEERRIRCWLAVRPELGDCLNCSSTPEFRFHHDAPGVLGCDCLEYVFPTKTKITGCEK